jgi:ankyrin repeat protein
MLLDKGANINARTKSDYAPLHFAVAQGDKEMTELLLDLGADPNVADDKGYTLLHFAAKKGAADIVRALLLKGADVNSPGKDGKRPQDLTRNSHILADLQSCGAAIEGFTPPEDYQPMEVPNSEKVMKIKEFNAFEKYFKGD